MFDTQAFLAQLHHNLNLLKEREAKHGSNVPLDLINQIDDHRKAIDLTEQACNGAISEAQWLDALQPLLISRSDWLGASLAAQLILEQYVGDQGTALAEMAGPQASAKAGEITSLVLEQVKAVDPSTAQKYPENPTRYQVSLNDVLDKILAANEGLVKQLVTMLEQYQTTVAATKPSQSTTSQANLSGSGVISQQSTQRAGERGVVGANVGGNLITGDGNVVGDNSVEGSRGAAVGGTRHQISVT